MGLRAATREGHVAKEARELFMYKPGNEAEALGTPAILGTPKGNSRAPGTRGERVRRTGNATKRSGTRPRARERWRDRGTQPRGRERTREPGTTRGTGRAQVATREQAGNEPGALENRRDILIRTCAKIRVMNGVDE